MYLDYYGLRLKPFQISTDPRFLWLGEKHQEALAVLKYGILDNKGFLLLTGDVGTGKTTLLNALVDSLGEEVRVAMVPDPGLEVMDFYRFTADAFGMEKPFQSKGEFLIYLKKYLIELNRNDQQALLIIDECQRLNQALLEEIRLLSNIEKTNVKLINIFFVGQSEFNDAILDYQNRAIRQRITINYNIDPLSRQEAAEYIRFRLKVAGATAAIFTEDAIDKIFAFSKGYPRLINIICDQALLTGYVKEQRHIEGGIITECARELKIESDSVVWDGGSAAPVQPQRIDDAGDHAGDVAADDDRPTTKRILVAVLVVLVVICLGLALSFFLGHSSPTTNPASEARLSRETASLAETGETITPTNASPKNPSPDLPALPLHQDAAVAGEKEPTRAGEIVPKPNGGAAADRGHRLSFPVPPAEPPQISLADLHANYGTYPEIQFAFNSNNLDAKAYPLLDEIARFCLAHPEAVVVLWGYTDASGSLAYNMKLSEFRAEMVKIYLVGKGVAENLITTIGVGPGEKGPAGTKVPLGEQRRKVMIEILMPLG